MINNLETEDRIKEANADTESLFVSATVLAIIRMVFMITSATFIGYSINRNGVQFFNELYGWNWLALFVYYGLGSQKSYLYLQDSSATFTLPVVFDILFVSVSSISVILVFCYWLLVSFASNGDVIGILSNPVRFVGYNVGLILVMIETWLSRVSIVKHYAAFAPVFVVLYIFWTWVTYYQFKWEWPIQVLGEYMSMQQNPYHLTIYFLVVLAISSISPVIVFLYILVRDAIGKKLSSVENDSNEKPIKGEA